MKFEVKRNGVVVFSTEYKSCIPDKDERDALRKSGHKLYLDGKLYTEGKKKPAADEEEIMDGQMVL